MAQAPDPAIPGEAYIQSLYGPKARAGDVQAQYLLGYAYENGLGVGVDTAVAAGWYVRAAEARHAPSQFRLAVLLQTGIGVERDLPRAADLYRRAAAGGVIEAQFNLAQMTELGLGVEAAPWVAAEMYEVAAEAGMPEAMRALGNLLARGFVGEAGREASDPVMAYIWLTRAVAAGDADSRRLADLVWRDMTEAQRSEARRLTS
ncbi:MAG: tetratricopeptide repeat protein [Alphaproteobacteria bacterium]|nr:tetratricopeptide repeat protein [Alphaproteobacteria bacterium]